MNSQEFRREWESFINNGDNDPKTHKTMLDKRLAAEWKLHHTGNAGGFDDMYGTTHIITFEYAPKLGGFEQLLNQANLMAAKKAISPRYWHETYIKSWVTDTEGIAIQVRRKDGKPTQAWYKYVELLRRLDDYPVLDDDILSNLQYEDLLDTLENCYKWGLERKGYTLPDNWVYMVAHRLENASCGDDIRESELYAIAEELFS